MNIYFLREIYQLITKEQPQHQIIQIKKISKSCTPFTNCISKINNNQIDNAEYTDIVMPMYNFIEYSKNYLKTSGSLWQYCKEISAVDDGDIVILTEITLLIHLILK